MLACLLVSVTTLAQQFTISKKNVTIEELSNEIAKNSTFTLVYQSSFASRIKPVSLHVTNATVYQLLDEYFRNQPYTYKFINQIITLIPKESFPASKLVSIKGKILNEQNEPVQGATIAIKGGTQQTETNENGEFTLLGIKDEINLNIVITSVNYEPQEVNWQGEPELDIRLKQHISQLGQVLVSTGYQKLAKGNTPGSFNKIDNELFNRAVSTNVLDRLDGVTSGLIFNKNTNLSNVNLNQSSISIRGRSTIFANPNPLIVIDNFPYTGDINNINPNDVDNITVLKDADAASIWGAYSGNGVIIITTKKGKYNQPLKLSFNSNVTVTQKPDQYYLPFLNSSDFIGVEQYLFDNGFYKSKEVSSYHPVLSPAVEIMIKKRDGVISESEAKAELDQLGSQDKRKDIDKYFYRHGVNQQYALSASGGSSNNNYYFSVGYDKNLSTLDRNEFNRITLTANNSFAWLKKKLELNTGIIFTASTLLNNNSGIINNISYPYAKVADDNGNPLVVYRDLRQSYKDSLAGLTNSPLLDWNFKPLDDLRNSDNSTKTNDYRINIDVKYNIFKGLDVTALYSYNKGYSDLENYQSQQTYFTRNLINQFTQVDSALGVVTHHIPLGGILDETYNRYEAHNVRSQLNYSRFWYNSNNSKKHAINAIAGAEVRSYKTQLDINRLYGYNKDLQTSTAVDYDNTFPLFYAPFITSRIDYKNRSRSTTDAYVSYYANAKYIFQSRYILSLSARKDESNLFGVKANQKGVPLWSAGLSWDVSQENFYHVGWMPFLKLRVTNGYNGNIDRSVAAFTTAQIDGGPNTWNAIPATIINPPNPSLRWEKNHMTNFGVDFALKNNIIEGSLEYYIRKGIDLIGNSPLDPTTGVVTFTGNSADMKGNGVDIVLHSRNINHNQFKWYSTVLFSHVVDKVTNYKVQQSQIWYYCDPGTLSPLTGKPLYSIYSFKWMGLNPLTGDPLGYLKDSGVSSNYNAIYTSSDLTNLKYIGPANPTYFGSLRNTFNWKQLELSFNITWKWGYYFRRSSINYYNLFNTQIGHPDYEKRWQKPGDEKNTNVPSMVYPANATRDAFYTYSDILVEKGDHIRLQDIQVSYNLNKSRYKALPVQALRIYLYANNIGIIWRANHYGIDPDYVNTIPNPRSIAAGVKLDF